MPTTSNIRMTTTPNGVTHDPETFTKLRSEIDVIRLTNANPEPNPSTPASINQATIRVNLSVAEAKNMIASVILPPATAGAAPVTIEVATLNPPLPGSNPNHISFRLRPGQSADWVLLSPLPDRADLLQVPGRGKRRSLTLDTIPHFVNPGDHADYHVEC